jgi:hypothetical protein
MQNDPRDVMKEFEFIIWKDEPHKLLNRESEVLENRNISDFFFKIGIEDHTIFHVFTIHRGKDNLRNGLVCR